MKKNIILCILYLTSLCSVTVVADVPAAQKAEVEHLLEYIKNSPCVFERNGRKHQARDAVEHIRKKYNYYMDDIRSTEDFIAYSATKSALSGSYYRVSCPGKASVRSRDWLLAELKRFRSRPKP